MLPIILGSSSSSRKKILEQAGIAFTTLSPDIDERQYHNPDPKQLALEIARAKAQALLPKIKTPALLITSDQVVDVNGILRGKPSTQEEARQYLVDYAVHPAHTNTAVVVTNTATGLQKEFVDVATVIFNPIPQQVIEALVANAATYTCAGGFQVEAEGGLSPYVKQILGTMDSVQGLPLTVTLAMLEDCSS